MSDELVNQITLNYLISKSQLQKLNNKIKQKEQDAMKCDKEIYKDQISELFTKCLNNEFPNDLLQEVWNSFTYFIEKSVYYLKLKANRSNEEENAVSNNDEEGDEDIKDGYEDTVVNPRRVYKKSSKPVHSEGVDDINKLPLDWFTKIKYNQNQNQNRVEKKNINNVYDNKKIKK